MPQPLTPAEARVLLDPDQVQGRDVVRTALMHLAALGHLRAGREEQRKWGFTSTVVRLRRTGRDASALPPHLRAVLDALGPDADGQGLQPTEVIGRLQKAFDAGYTRLLRDHFRGPLVERGLLRREETRVLGVFPRTRHARTAEGEHLAGDLRAGIEAADRIPALLGSDPVRAAATAAALGGAVLLADGLRPHLPALGEAVRGHAPAADDVALAFLPPEEEDRRERWAEAMEMLGDIDWGTVLGALDDVADAFDAGDGGGADGGGDGGGGGE